MYNLCKIYIFVYILYVSFGYDCITKLINNRVPKTIFSEHDILTKRLLQLSLITLLISALFFNSDFDTTIFIIALLLNIIVCVGYFIKFYPLKDPLTWIFHILWAIPIFIVPFFCKLNGHLNVEILLIIISILILYKFILEDYVYG